MTLVFRHAKHEAGDTYSFFFEAASTLHYIAGQSIKIALPGEYDNIERRFTISSAPAEHLVRITTRVHKGEFKQKLMTLKPGEEIRGFNIEGSFTWRESELPKVFIAAGIGITPYRSILAQRAAESRPLNATLIYGNHDEHVVFRDELDTWQQAYPEFTVNYEIGRRLDGAFISQHCDIKKSLLFVSGPSQMVDDLTESLFKHGAKEQFIIRDWFTGYK